VIGEALRLLRIFNDCKRIDLAEGIGVTRAFLSGIENNKRTPSMRTLQKYADYFDVTVSAIMLFAEDIEKDKKKPAKEAMRSKLIKFTQMMRWDHVTESLK